MTLNIMPFPVAYCLFLLIWMGRPTGFRENFFLLPCQELTAVPFTYSV